mgnify:FL=1
MHSLQKNMLSISIANNNHAQILAVEIWSKYMKTTRLHDLTATIQMRISDKQLPLCSK